MQEVGILDGRLHYQVHGPPEKPSESFQQAEIGVRIGVESRGLKLDQEVQVALFRIVRAGCGGPEQVEPPYPVLQAETLQFIGPLLDDRDQPASSRFAPNPGRAVFPSITVSGLCISACCSGG
ncbi:MAG: hypothetical protein OXL36_18775 [Bryobacterales bacterium]|nr:hypothetical protein [Bryobacterales bacterium]MDE0294840.1 hypothetical protein [Bryobacterales bacterium]